jgi:high-affinity K+ transport system ATPase subunit B
VEDIAKQGGTPLVVVDGARVLGVVQLKDIVSLPDTFPGRRFST